MRVYWRLISGTVAMWWFALAAVVFGGMFWPQAGINAVSSDDAAQDGQAAVMPAPVQMPVLTPALAATEATPAPAPEPPPAATPPAPLPAPENLAKALQTELKRLGCYGGRIDNQWGTASRYALRRFMRTAGLQTGDGRFTAQTISVLQGYKDSTRCIAEPAAANAPAPAQIQAAASAPADTPVASKPAADDHSYLPPWMRNDGASAHKTTAEHTAPKQRRQYKSTQTADQPVPEINRPVREAGVRPKKVRKRSVAGVIIRRYPAPYGWPRD
jgi:hypothetical protein